MKNDTEVFDRIKKGDKEAYKIIVQKYMKRAYFTALGFVGNRDDALDLSQTAFIKAYRSLPKFDHQRSFFPWFYAILRNLCFNFIKKRKRSQTVPIEMVGNSNLVSQRNNREAVKEEVWRAISALPKQDKEIILLKYFQDLSYKEIAETLSCPIGTVMSRLYYARKKLKEKLKI
jgi:RNA polymerase sigma-70 factor (ECF subfamily)